MGFKNTSDSYGSVNKFIHWLIFFVVTSMLICGFLMPSLEKDSLKYFIYDVHKAIGLTIIAIMLFRLYWALTNVKPSLPLQTKSWEIWATRIGHFSLYALVFAMPVTGWIMSSAAGYDPSWFGLFTAKFPGITVDKALSKQFNEIHEIVAWVLIAAIILHVLAALKHHFIDKDNVLLRMMPTRKSPR